MDLIANQVIPEPDDNDTKHPDGRPKRAAEKRANEIVDTGGGRGEVRSQKIDGQWGDSDSGSKNESPAKDKEH